MILVSDCAVYVSNAHLHFFFYHGNILSDKSQNSSFYDSSPLCHLLESSKIMIKSIPHTSQLFQHQVQ